VCCAGDCGDGYRHLAPTPPIPCARLTFDVAVIDVVSTIRCLAGPLIGLAVVGGAGVARFVCGATGLLRALGRAFGPRSPGPGRDRAIVGFANACAVALYVSIKSISDVMVTGTLAAARALVFAGARPHVAGPVPGPGAERTSRRAFVRVPDPTIGIGEAGTWTPSALIVGLAGAGPAPVCEDNLAVELVLRRVTDDRGGGLQYGHVGGTVVPCTCSTTTRASHAMHSVEILTHRARARARAGDCMRVGVSAGRLLIDHLACIGGVERVAIARHVARPPLDDFATTVVY